MNRTKAVNLRQLALKCRSKKEVYNVLLTDCNVYLPPIQFANSSYIRGVIRGEIKHVEADSVKTIQIPQIDALTVRSIMEFGLSHFDLKSYLPKYKMARQPNRPWLCNLIHTVVGKPFKDWVDSKMRDREKYLIKANSFIVQALPKFAKAFTESRSVSLVYGKSNLLLGEPRKKRIKECEYRELELTTNELDNKNAELQAEIDVLNAKLIEYKDRLRESNKSKDMRNELKEKDIINEDEVEIIRF